MKYHSFLTKNLIAVSLLASSALSIHAQAQTTDVPKVAADSPPLIVDSPYSYSGFASLIGGQSSGRCQPTGMAQDTTSCTRYVGDWGHDGIYNNNFSIAQESRIGVQFTDKFTHDLSGTIQLTARPIRDEHLNLEWAYLTYKPDSSWTIYIGRKRLPLFYYSDIQDIGYAYNTIRLDGSIYGWEVTNYNGISVDYSFNVADWDVRAEMLVGTEDAKNNAYERLFYATPQDIGWHRIVGMSFDFSHDWLTGRLGYEHSDYSQFDAVTGAVPLFTGGYQASQSFLDASLTADLNDWILHTEFGDAHRLGIGALARFYSVSAGYRMGKFLPTIQYGTYRESTPFANYNDGKFQTAVLALRYDFAKNMDFKVQLDRAIDNGQPPLQGSAYLVSAGIDIVF
ncbi:hypothetical protein [Solimicrobium silvestre]|uniref:Porin domain-containing protein n=1 Tax=Solimicrobium silvestre TaxID=2099400 RepID=A0A2S9GSW6_9BURK|nr:hypothetical protein [Solimicrobium silvestre]PRC90814.1 hypothetical protein S2091_4477 [Solimicrobium silvestre]